MSWMGQSVRLDEQRATLKEAVYIIDRVLRDYDCYDQRTAEVYEALENIVKHRPYLRWKCVQFREALDDYRPDQLAGLTLQIKQQINI